MKTPLYAIGDVIETESGLYKINKVEIGENYIGYWDDCIFIDESEVKYVYQVVEY